MNQYRFQAVDQGGAIFKGTLQARNLTDARETLRQRALLPVTLTPVDTSSSKSKPIKIGESRKRAIKPALLSVIARQLASLVANDVRIEDALATIARQEMPKYEAGVLIEFRRQIVEGQTFADALSTIPGAVPRAFIASIAAGEASGRLDVVLVHLADYTEARQTNRQTIQLALIYPAFLALISGTIVVLLLTQVVPDVVVVYQRRGADLPMATDILIGISDFLVQFGLPLLGVIIAAIVGANVFVSTKSGALRWAAMLLRLPGIGAFLKRKNAAEIAGTLAMLISAGVPLVQALRISAGVISNVIIKDKLKTAADDVKDGVPIDTAMSRTQFVPPMMLAMVSSGIKSGQLDQALSRAAKDQQLGLDQKTKALVALLEPSVLLVMGAVILFIVLAIITPIVDLNTLSGV